MMASRPIELPGVSGAGWQRTLTGPVKGRSVQQVKREKGGLQVQTMLSEATVMIQLQEHEEVRPYIQHPMS